MSASDIISDDAAIEHLRLDGMDSPDPRLEDMRSKRDQAVAIVCDYLHVDLDDSPGPAIEDHVKAAILMVLSGLWESRNPDADVLTSAVKDLLSRSRDPVFA